MATCIITLIINPFSLLTQKEIFDLFIYLMVLVIIIMYANATRSARRAHFERFYYTHHLFVVFYGLLLAHGASKILGSHE